MKNNSIKVSFWKNLFFLLGAFSLIEFASCDDGMKDVIYKTSNVQVVDEFLEDQKNNVSDFLAIIDKADYRGMLHAYGTYTCFIPTNDALRVYFNETRASLETLTKEQAEEIIGLHIVNDTLSTNAFVDGRLPSPSISGQYLTVRTQVDETNGEVYLELNRQARILQKNILLGNGYVHVIDKILESAKKTLAETIENLPDEKYSFIKGLVKETEFDKVLSRTDAIFTFFLQSNKVYEDLGINSKNALLQRLKENTPEVTTDAELLLNYVKYHCVPDRKYVTDLMATSTTPTYDSKQVLAFSMNKEVLLINDFKVGKIIEIGIPIDRNSEWTDLTCANGVIHEIEGQIEIRSRKAYRIYWDIAEQPEIKALKTFRKSGSPAVVFKQDELSEMTWGGKNTPTVTYYCDTYTSDGKTQYVYSDHLEFRLDTNVMQWLELKTPLLVEGNYKIWICWRRMQAITFRSIFKQDGEEDQVLPTVFDMSAYMPLYYTDDTKKNVDYDKMEQEGWKQYNAKTIINVFNSRLVGTIRVVATGRHTLRFEALGGSKAPGNAWDMIQFIPVDEDQVWPMVAANGDLIYKGTPGCQIYPDDGSKCVVEEPEPVQ
ncbi:hypothetical protein EZS27_010069 [termite gut metagenome]|uniref:FAS1 domain-containing protein n=1 Tax=termite gut metagenome TaxID=433724 RepID=A0A5J4SA65_9ZZZZ